MRSERETREKARLKTSERGRFLAFQNNREKDLSTALAVAFGDELKFSR